MVAASAMMGSAESGVMVQTVVTALQFGSARGMLKATRSGVPPTFGVAFASVMA
jgi:hypothetical protein